MQQKQSHAAAGAAEAVRQADRARRVERSGCDSHGALARWRCRTERELPIGQRLPPVRWSEVVPLEIEGYSREVFPRETEAADENDPHDVKESVESRKKDGELAQDNQLRKPGR